MDGVNKMKKQIEDAYKFANIGIKYCIKDYERLCKLAKSQQHEIERLHVVVGEKADKIRYLERDMVDLRGVVHHWKKMYERSQTALVILRKR